MKRNRKSANSGHAPRTTRRKPPGRVRLAAADRGQAILAAAKSLFLQQGYAATSLEQVVARSGGSLATVYRLFGNKEGLWRALISGFTARIGAPLRAPAAHDGHAREALIAMGLEMAEVECSAEAGGGVRLMLAESARSPELARNLFAYGPDAGRAMLARYFAEETAAGRLSVPDPALAAEQFCHLIAGDRLLRNACGLLKPPNADQERRRVAAAVDLFLKSYEV
jgi:AcrR family transcriptional regulator